MFYWNLDDRGNNRNMNINSNNMYTADVMVPFWYDTTVQQQVTMPTQIVTLTDLCVLRRDPVLQIPDSTTQCNLFLVNNTKALVTRPMITIKERRRFNMPTIRFPQNSDEFTHMLDQFTC